jgi:hypothetical protein
VSFSEDRAISWMADALILAQKHSDFRLHLA